MFTKLWFWSFSESLLSSSSCKCFYSFTFLGQVFLLGYNCCFSLKLFLSVVLLSVFLFINCVRCFGLLVKCFLKFCLYVCIQCMWYCLIILYIFWFWGHISSFRWIYPRGFCVCLNAIITLILNLLSFQFIGGFYVCV